MQSATSTKTDLLTFFKRVRTHSHTLCEPLEIEDFVVQPVKDVSPIKWHLAHTTWFFESFVLKPSFEGYKEYHPKYALLFNSYYISAGDRWTRENRGQLTRPTVQEIFAYREHVDRAMESFLTTADLSEELHAVITLGCHHEQQHQELFLYDIKRILGDNPLFPPYSTVSKEEKNSKYDSTWLTIQEGTYEVGYEGEGFHFDNERGRHTVFLHEYQIQSGLVTNGAFMQFIQEGGYTNHMLWLSEGWDWVNGNAIHAPRYWHLEDGGVWWHYTLNGYEPVDPNDPLCHISYYEAEAYARWKECRLPTEQEWEVACKIHASEDLSEGNFVEDMRWRPVQSPSFLGNVWQWTSSAYAPYPYFQQAEGALGEYNGKFMVNQMVLRGGSFGTSRTHIRPTYRNFFHPHLRWMFAGIRLAKHSKK